MPWYGAPRKQKPRDNKRSPMESTTSKVTKTIQVPLTESEIVEKAISVAKLSKEIEKEENAFKVLRSEHRAELERLDGEVEKTLDVIIARKEPRELECQMVKYFEANRIEYIFEGRVVEERPMEPYERQMELEDGKGLEDEMEDFEPGDPDDDGDGEALPIAARQ